MKPLPKQWHRRIGHEVSWTRVGIGLEITAGHWYPNEWGVYVQVGPLMLWCCIETCDDFCRDHNHFREAK